VCAVVYWLTRAFCCPRMIVQAGGCKARHSGSASSPDLDLIEHGDFAARPCGGRWTAQPCRWITAILVGPASVQYRELSKAYQTRFVVWQRACAHRKGGQWTACHTGKMVRLRIGHARLSSPRKRWAFTAVLWRYMAMKTRRVALLIAQRDTRHVLRSASATASCAGSGWSDDGEGCGCDPEYCRGCAISRQSVQWLRGVLPRPKQVHHAPEWPPVFLVSVSPDYEVGQALVSPVWISSQHRSGQKKRITTRVYVNIWVGIHTQTGCLESFLQFVDWVF